MDALSKNIPVIKGADQPKKVNIAEIKIVNIPKNIKFSRVKISELKELDFVFGLFIKWKNNETAKKNITNATR